MFESITSFYNILQNKEGSLNKRIISIFVILLIVILFDNIFKVSYNKFVDTKLNQLQTISQLKNDYKKEKLKLTYFIKLEKEVYSSKHYSEIIYESITLNNSKNLSLLTCSIAISYPFILLLLAFIMLPLFTDELRRNSAYKAWFLILFFLSFLIIFLTLISYYIIPIIYNPTINYIIYFLFSTIVMILFFKYVLFKNL